MVTVKVPSVSAVIDADDGKAPVLKDVAAIPVPTSRCPSRRIRGRWSRVGPAEPARAFTQAGDEVAAAERQPGHRADGGLVAQPEFERVHAQPLRQLVHGGLERERAGRRTGSTHRERRQDVERDRGEPGADRRRRVQRLGDLGAVLDVLARAARARTPARGGSPAGGRRRRRRAGPVARSPAAARSPRNTWLAGQRDPHRPAEPRRGHDGQDQLRAAQPLGPEPAADVFGADPHLLEASGRTAWPVRWRR